MRYKVVALIIGRYSSIAGQGNADGYTFYHEDTTLRFEGNGLENSIKKYGNAIYRTDSNGKVYTFGAGYGTFGDYYYGDPYALIKSTYNDSCGYNGYNTECNDGYTSYSHSYTLCCRPFTWPASNYPSYGMSSPIASSVENHTFACYNMSSQGLAR